MKHIVAVSVLALAVSAPLRAQDVAEPQTGVKFAVKADGASLVGVGLRVKKIAFIKAKVYAIGLYVSDAALAGPLAVHKGKLGTPEFYKDLVWGDFDKHLTLKFVRSLGQEKIQEAMREALAARADKKLLDQFVGYFPAIEQRQECVLGWVPGGTLAVTMKGEAKPPIVNKEFAAAVFGLYLGDAPLQQDIKEGLVSRAGELLKP